jgi:hypothetical protein
MELCCGEVGTPGLWHWYMGPWRCRECQRVIERGRMAHRIKIRLATPKQASPFFSIFPKTHPPPHSSISHSTQHTTQVHTKMASTSTSAQLHCALLQQPSTPTDQKFTTPGSGSVARARRRRRKNQRASVIPSTPTPTPAPQHSVAEDHRLQSMLADYESQETGFLKHTQEQLKSDRKRRAARTKIFQRTGVIPGGKQPGKAGSAGVVSTSLRLRKLVASERNNLKQKLDLEVKHRVLLEEQLRSERARWKVAQSEMEGELGRERERARKAMGEVETLEKAIIVLARRGEERGV